MQTDSSLPDPDGLHRPWLSRSSRFAYADTESLNAARGKNDPPQHLGAPTHHLIVASPVVITPAGSGQHDRTADIGARGPGHRRTKEQSPGTGLALLHGMPAKRSIP